MERARRIVERARAAPVATLAGLTVVPILHLLLRSGRLQSSTVINSVQSRTTATRANAADAEKIADSIKLGAKVWRLQDTSCVARSLVCWGLCRSKGNDASVMIGMDSETRKAHAWVEIEQTPIGEAADVADRYLPFDNPLTGGTLD